MTVAAAGTMPGYTAPVRVFFDEVGKGLRLAWRRRWLVAGAMAENALGYLAVRFLIGGGRIRTPIVAATLPALAALFVASVAALQASAGIAEEVNSGTLEQVQLSAARPTVLAAGKLAALGVEGLLGGGVLALGMGLAFGVHYAPSPGVVVPALLTLLDSLGYAFLFMGLTLAVASVGAITHVFNMALLLFNGTLVPITVFPGGIQAGLKILPTTLGIQVLNSSLSGQPLRTSWDNGTLPLLIVHTLVLVAVGWSVYAFALRRARLGGGLVAR